ncbi:hypothetical protein FZ103_22465 [Streptomonospora sp. PA3]|uniref:peptidase inhibitor family I36 protein n=1 Tax=Streptomonospora sp. PA3 TaxID=2607326 RepID=UPI0012DD0FC2|nr:peptidase inhibitor family I36 protein [Streptomonospora sp. PA3]MUL43891.1 hypothetical protein [Streptomonospora sp. PA3]
MRGHLRAALLAAATAALAAALAAAPLTASADDSFTQRPPDCEPGSICGYTGYGFTGETIHLPAGAGCVTPKAPLRSIANTYGSPGIPAAALLYSGPGCTGSVIDNAGQEEAIPYLIPDAQSVMLAW